jgi:phosphoglycerate dehydrogenase-like enzyme
VKAVIVAGGGDGYATDLTRRIEAQGVPLVRVDPGDREALGRELVDADALLCNRLEPGDTEGATRLRLVQALSAGADRVDAAAVPAGCTLCNLFGHEQAMAEWVLMAMLALSRRALTYDRRLREGDWAADLPWEVELSGRVVATVGYGHIGRRVAELSRAIGMDVVAVTRSPSPGRADGLRRLAGIDELAGVLDEADFAVVAVPSTPDTRGLIDAAELRCLGPDGYLVNVARGDVVDERALYEALREGTIAGAAVDVWYRYPRGGAQRFPSDYPIHELDNVLMAPHVSGRTTGTQERRAAFLAEQLRRLEEGRPLENVLAVAPPS